MDWQQAGEKSGRGKKGDVHGTNADSASLGESSFSLCVKSDPRRSALVCCT